MHKYLPVTTITFSEYRHGTQNCYCRHKCRCDLCKKAHNKNNLNQYKMKRLKLFLRNHTPQIENCIRLEEHEPIL